MIRPLSPRLSPKLARCSTSRSRRSPKRKSRSRSPSQSPAFRECFPSASKSSRPLLHRTPLNSCSGLKGVAPLRPCDCLQRVTHGEVGAGLSHFRPLPGDIIIHRDERRCGLGNADVGFLAVYKDDLFFERTVVQDIMTLNENYAHDFVKGDIIVRMGTFDEHWRWNPSKVVYVFVCEDKHFWWLVAKVAMHPLQAPVHSDLKENPKAVSSPDLYFKPRDGDFIIRGTPGFDNLKKWDALWWRAGMEMKYFDILVRAGYGASKEFGNCNVTEVIAEMYWLYDTLTYWIFVGRDVHRYAAGKHSSKNQAYTVALPRSNMLSGWQHVQDALRRKRNKTFFRHQRPGQQRRVLDQPYDHNLPHAFDHLGFDELE